MNHFKILCFLICALFLSCSSEEEQVPSDNCTELQQELNDATNDKLDTFGAYVQDTQNTALCEAYADALRVRIEKAQAMLDANCLPASTAATTAQAIQEDQESLNDLDC